MTTRKLLAGVAAAALDPETAKRSVRIQDQIVRADAEEGEKEEGKEEKTADAMLRDFIADMKGTADAMKSCMDAMGKRMDALEGAEKAREDKARKDAEEAEMKAREDARRKDGEGGDEMNEGEGKPERVAADKKRKDNAEDTGEEKNRQDGERHADAAPVSRAEFEALQRRYADLEKVATFVDRPRDDAAAAALANAQARADRVLSLAGKRAPRPLANEPVADYERRICRDLKAHSRLYKDENLQLIPDGAVLRGVVDSIYADAEAFYRSPESIPDGQLLMVDDSRPGGPVIKKPMGRSRTWLLPMAAPAQAVTRIHQPN